MLFDNPIAASNVLKQTTNQLYIAPHPLLREYVAHYTVSLPASHPKKTSSKEYKELTLIPDASGCIIYTFSGGQLSESLWGPTSKIVKVKDDSSNNVFRFFIEFLPGGLYALTGISQIELIDKKLDVYEADQYLSLALRRILETSNHLNEVIIQVNDVLLRVASKYQKIHCPVPLIIKQLKYHHGNITIKDLAANTYISHRHINRLLECHVGMNAKQFARLIRINKAAQTYKSCLYSTSKEAAQMLGFFDESHLIRDFKEFCDTTPRAFLKNMSNYYNEAFKY
ncbi:MAG: AraC family transcriptional regulator [Clostridia bacterium]|jgi:AraC-like DNA-binding protein|nr:AraC family transcriptional regulator [Clostridia bacterium]